jgi:hypothetical protein
MTPGDQTILLVVSGKAANKMMLMCSIFMPLQC